MIVCKLTLVSAITGRESDLGTIVISNDGTGGHTLGNYDVRALKRNSKLSSVPTREGKVRGHRREALSVWCLVHKALSAMGYDVK